MFTLRVNLLHGLDDLPDDDCDACHTLIEPCPNRREVLKAVSTVGRYIEDMNDPIARKLEALLGSFNMQVRLEETKSLKNTLSTDYFRRK